jgi:hypothetical protein
MLPLFDLLAQAQNGQGIEMLAKQFNLSQQQAEAAVEALLPAFSQGLKRNTTDPYGLTAFMTAMANGQHAKAFDDAGLAFSQQGVAQGNAVLGQLFGSKDLSRAVAAQAAQATGIGQQVLQQMLPAIASMVMGGLFKQTTNQIPAGHGAASQNAGGMAGDNPLGRILQEMMKQGGGMAGGQNTQQQSPFDPATDNPLGKILQDMFGGGAPQQAPGGSQPQMPQNPLDGTPWGKILQDMFGGAQGQAQQPAPQGGTGTRSSTDDNGQPKNPYDEIFGRMFETGRQQRDDYQKGVETVFDQFLKGMDRSR